MARVAGVSVGSVSRVLNNSAHVSPDLRSRVEQAVSELGFVPSFFAQGMRGTVTHMIGIIVRDIASPLLARFVRAAQEELETTGYLVLVACHDERKERELDLLRILTKRHVDGLIMTTASEEDAELVRLITIAVRDLGVHELRFTGGEPLLRRGLEDVIAASAALGHRTVPDLVEQAQANAPRAHVGFEISDDFEAGCRDTDVVYAKSWGALNTTTDADEGARIIEQYSDWIADERRMAMANDEAIYMHPLPADRNVEVADAVIDGPQSAVYDQAENRLHGQKAVMALTMR